jgi:hypothetical protein
MFVRMYINFNPSLSIESEQDESINGGFATNSLKFPCYTAVWHFVESKRPPLCSSEGPVVE